MDLSLKGFFYDAEHQRRVVGLVKLWFCHSSVSEIIALFHGPASTQHASHSHLIASV